MARVTLQTIADEVGVSRMTVSNAFSKPDQLSGELRSRILATAERLGYSGPDPAARALARGRSGLIGVILTRSPSDAFTDAVTTGFLGAVAQALQPSGMSLALLDASGTGEIDPAQTIPMDAAILYSCVPHTQAVATLRRRGVPVVVVDEIPFDGLPAVNVEDRVGARAAARHLLHLGHRRIVIVTARVEAPEGVSLSDVRTDPTNHVMVERLRGWGDALAEDGVDATVVGLHDVGHDEACTLLAPVFARADRPTAVLAYSDVVAAGVARAASDAGLVVPRDVSIVGFDDNPLAARHVPPLTTVRQDLHAKGEATVAQVLAVIAADRAGVPRESTRVVLPTSLVVRESTAPPPPD